MRCNSAHGALPVPAALNERAMKGSGCDCFIPGRARRIA